MHWFYSISNERLGPVPASELLALRNQETIGEATLVWRDGLESWVPFSAVRAELSGQGDLPLRTEFPSSNSQKCSQCQGSFSPDDLLSINGEKVCAACKPLFLQKLREGVGSGGLWRQGKKLVVGLNARLPDRCIKCNGDAHGDRLKRPLYWHHPALYVMVLFPGILIYAIVAMIVRKKVTLDVGLCQKHASGRRRSILVAWLLALAGFVAIGFGASSTDPEFGPIGIGAGILLIIGALIWGVFRSRMVHALKIEAHQAFIGGACPEYLAELPQWTGK